MNKNYGDISGLYPLLQLGLAKLNLDLSKTTLEKIIAYIALLHKWNKVHNLTAISDPKAILIRHIFDSLAIIPYIAKEGYVLDFGTGAGFPGIPLALALPEHNFVLLDSSNKKTTFLNHVVLSLNIKNVKIVTKRIEEFHFEHLFATIVTRATAKSDVVIAKTSHLCTKDGKILIMKGKPPQEELKSVKKPFEIYRIEVPCLNEDRHIVRILN